jgi:essential nuclear protein 1
MLTIDECNDKKLKENGEFSHRLKEIYKRIGKLLQRYTTGSIPKAFKMMPNFKDWEKIVLITEPEYWTPHAIYQGTRLFVSNWDTKKSQRFFKIVLLPKIRNCIRETSRLHFMLFQSLKKALYKPSAFYRGVLLPLCNSNLSTIREAVIISSVLRRVSIPAVHSVSALTLLSKMEYRNVTNYFIQVLLDKKYLLSYRVINSTVDYFLSFRTNTTKLPITWHYSLLTFVKRYRHVISANHKEALGSLTKIHFHNQMSPEVQIVLDS